jgi:hypothetical protein
METKKVPPEDTEVKYGSHSHYSQTASAPPMEFYGGAMSPPSYDQAVSAPSVVMPTMPTPHYMPLQAGKGCILLLQFPCQDAVYVGDFFKRNVPNLLLHDGKVLAFIPEMQFFPSHKTAALVIHFGAERTALSWLQNMKSSAPDLVSRWWGMIVENNTEIKLPSNHTRFKFVSLVLMKQKADFVASKEHTSLYSQLLKEALPPAKTRHDVLNIVSGRPVFACGDWSFFQARSSELSLSISLFPSSDHRAGYIQEFKNDSRLTQFNELASQKNVYLFTGGFLTGDVYKFQDL